MAEKTRVKTIPNNTGICFANPLKATQQKIVAANVIRATKKYFKS